jgi:DNA-directed RNA polymerase subunit RPC12/RpoP
MPAPGPVTPPPIRHPRSLCSHNRPAAGAPTGCAPPTTSDNVASQQDLLIICQYCSSRCVTHTRARRARQPPGGGHRLGVQVQSPPECDHKTRRATGGCDSGGRAALEHSRLASAATRRQRAAAVCAPIRLRDGQIESPRRWWRRRRRRPKRVCVHAQRTASEISRAIWANAQRGPDRVAVLTSSSRRSGAAI